MSIAPVTPITGHDGSPTERIVLVVTGASSAAFAPYWLNWISLERPDVRIRVLVSPQALRFVTTASLASPLVDDVTVDSWDAADDRPLHVELSAWAEAFIVYPASQNYLASMASDAADRPSLLALQLTTAPVVVAPSVPPGGLESAALRRSWAAIESRPNVEILPPIPGSSRFRDDLTSWISAPMGEVFERLDAMTAPSSADGVEFGTRLLRTEIAPSPTGWSWTRRTAPEAPRPFTPRDDAAFAALESAAVPGLVFPGAPAGDPAIRRYDVPGPRSIAALLLEQGPDAVDPRALAELGATLRAAHEASVPAVPASRSRGLSRLTDWLELRDQPPLMRSAHRELLPMAPGAVRTVGAALAELDALAADGPVLCHGAPGLGSIVIDGDSGSPVLLAGEDVHVGSRDSDLLWVLGELLEFSFTRADDARAWSRAIDAFLDGYGHATAISATVLAAVRILLHLHDYTAYVGWSSGEFHRYGGMLRYLTDSEVTA